MNEPDEGGKETGDAQEAEGDATKDESPKPELGEAAGPNETGEELVADSVCSGGVAASEPVDCGEPELTTATDERS